MTLSVVAMVVGTVPLLATPASAEAQRPGNGGGLSAALVAPKGLSLPGGGEATATGDFTHSYAFELPEGRKGQTPSLGLSYLSSGPVHGGVAAGWQLSRSAITVDRGSGTVSPTRPEGGTVAAPRNFLDPAGRPLVPDPSLPVSAGGVGYRAAGDSSFVRYEFLGAVASSPFWWQAFTSDGVLHRYGSKAQHPHQYAPLMSVLDGDGHELRYSYTTVGRMPTAPTATQPREFLLAGVDYVSPGQSEPYARVVFGYGVPTYCGSSGTQLPVGARLDYSSGVGLLSGTRRLERVTTSVRPTTGAALRNVRKYELAYADTDSCSSGTTTPFRQLASVQVTAYSPNITSGPGATTTSPPTTFTYGKAAAYVSAEHYEDPEPIANLRMPESIDTNARLKPLEANDSYELQSGTQVCDAPMCPIPELRADDLDNDHHHPAWYLSQGQASGESVTRMLVDINGDNRVDLIERPGRFELSSPSNAPPMGGCKIDVYLNKGDRFEKQADNGEFAPFSLVRALADVGVPSLDEEDGGDRILCSLSRSFVTLGNGGWFSDPSYSCGDVRNNWHAGRGFDSIQQVVHGFIDMDQDGRVDLVSQPIASVRCPYASTHSIPRPIATQFPTQEDPHWSAEYLFPQEQPVSAPAGYWDLVTKRQNNWYWYRNTGNGFAEVATRVAVPRKTQLDPNGWVSGDRSALPQPDVFSSLNIDSSAGTGTKRSPQSVADLTGDGYLDFITPDRRVFTGRNGSVSDTAVPLTQGDNVAVPTWMSRDDGPDDDSQYHGHLKAGLGPDINGDGLPDLVRTTGEGSEISFNTGVGFGADSNDGKVFFSQGTEETKQLESFEVEIGHKESYQNYAYDAVRFRQNRMVDLDYDGLLDVLRNNNRVAGTLYLNGGRQWVKNTHVSTFVVNGLAGVVHGRGVTARVADRIDVRHQTGTQAVDIDGDGLLDIVEDGDDDGNSTVRHARAILDEREDHAAPARLLRSVSNGYGAKTLIGYSRDVAAGKWVVNEVTTQPGQGEPAMSTEYHYRQPIRTADPYGQHTFRGYAETRALKVGDPGIRGDDLTTVTLYAYDQDYRGVVVRSAVVLGDSAFASPNGFSFGSQAGVMSLTDHTYHVRDLGLTAPGWSQGFIARVVLPKGTTTHTCPGATGQTAQVCVNLGIKITKDTAYAPHTSASGTYVMEKVQSTETRFTNGEGKPVVRRSTPVTNVAWSAAVFNTAPASATTDVTVDGVTTPIGQLVYSYYDAEFRQGKSTTARDLRSSAADRTVRVQYYGGTGANRGQVYRTWAPEQIGFYGNSNTSPGFTEYAYDAHGVAVTRVKSPVDIVRLGTTTPPAYRTDHHVVDSIVDLGTGTTIETRGPDYVCSDGPDGGTNPDPATACTFDNALFTQRVDLLIDGFGRMRSTVKYPTQAGAGVQVARASYDDHAAHTSGGTTPVSMVAETAVGDGKFSHSTTEVDGLGRVVRTLLKQDNLPDRVNTFDYDASGNNHQAFGPRADAGGGVTGTRSTFDPLGRVVSIAEIGEGDRVFSQTTYDGLATTVTQNTDDGSQRATTRTTTDVAGQLVTVAEAMGPTQWATTRYLADGAGNIASITDPDGVVTQMTHDGFGQRTSLTTGSKTWTYRYDGNGNATEITEPLPPGGRSEDHTHKSLYDPANRLVKEIPATRGRDAATMAALGISTKTYGYDGAALGNDPSTQNLVNQVGRLTWTDSAVTRTVNHYDSHGGPKSSSQVVKALDNVIPNLVQTDRLQVDTAFDSSGVMESMEYRAYTPGSNNPLVTHDGPRIDYAYDRAGRQAGASWRIGSKDMTVINHTNTAGAVTNRITNANNTSGFASPTITYTRDRFGRVESMIAKNDGVQRYRQTLSYLQNGEIGQIAEQLGDVTKPVATTTYRYDRRQQLLSADQDTVPVSPDAPVRNYQAQFTHTAGGRMASANVALTGADEADGSRVHGRNVTYVYNAADPQRLDHLRRVGDGSNMASYLYDEVGNTISRTLPDGTVVGQEWDGTRLSKVSKPGGESETYFYDGATRVAAVHRNADGSLNTVRRWFDSLEVIYQSGKAPVYRQGIGLGGETVARHDGDDVTGKTEHVLTSNQGHHVLALKADGTTMRVASYGAYGEVLAELVNPNNLPAFDKYTEEFNGKTRDTVSGLHYYGHRYYDPLALQWTSTDPLYRHKPDLRPITPRSANLYTYTDNNPIGKVDPTGLDPGFQGMVDAFFASKGHGYNKQLQDEFGAGLTKAALTGITLGTFYSMPFVGDVYDLATADSLPDALGAAAGILTAGIVDVRVIKAIRSGSALGAGGRALRGGKDPSVLFSNPRPRATKPAKSAVASSGASGLDEVIPGVYRVDASNAASLPPGQYAAIIPLDNPRSLFVGRVKGADDANNLGTRLAEGGKVTPATYWGVLVDKANDGSVTLRWHVRSINGNIQIFELNSQPLDSVKGVVRGMFGSRAAEPDNIPNSPITDFDSQMRYDMYKEESRMWDNDPE